MRPHENRKEATAAEISATWPKDEQRWLGTFRNAIAAKHSATVKEMIVFGSKARGDWNPDSDIDVLLIVEGEGKRIREVLDLGHGLAAGSDAIPTIIARTGAAWSRLRQLRTAFYETVEQDGVRIVPPPVSNQEPDPQDEPFSTA